MNQARRIILFSVVLLALSALPPAWAAQPQRAIKQDRGAAPISANSTSFMLAPYKDRLFGYPRILSSKYGGDYLKVQYVKSRDLYQRDAVPMKRAHPQYLSLETRRHEKDYTLREGRTKVRFIGVGNISGGARMIVIFVHGKNGTRFLGANDLMFGGNFNRIKNLMVRNEGAYASPGLRNFREGGTRQVALLIKTLKERSPGAPVFVACGSMGGAICWRLINTPSTARNLSGILLLGSTYDHTFLKSRAFRSFARPIPIYLGHGGDDRIFNWKGQARFFKKVRQLSPGYPIRMVLFDSGSHGTPIRMTDWRDILNWMLSRR